MTLYTVLQLSRFCKDTYRVVLKLADFEKSVVSIAKVDVNIYTNVVMALLNTDSSYILAPNINATTKATRVM